MARGEPSRTAARASEGAGESNRAAASAMAWRVTAAPASRAETNRVARRRRRLGRGAPRRAAIRACDDVAPAVALSASPTVEPQLARRKPQDRDRRGERECQEAAQRRRVRVVHAARGPGALALERAPRSWAQAAFADEAAADDDEAAADGVASATTLSVIDLNASTLIFRISAPIFAVYASVSF